MTNGSATGGQVATGGISRLLPGSALEYLIHGCRLTAAVVLALFIAYRLELDNPFWAGITAAVACQPSLGSSLQKGKVRFVGTIVGAVAIILLTAAMPQSRAGMFAGLALWIGFCGGMATVLRNLGSYGAALAGFTAAVLFSDAVANPDETFLLACTRTAEIGIGIVSAGIALIVTDIGTTRHRLADAFVNTAQATARGFADLLVEGREDVITRDWRRRLIGNVVALDGLIDEAIGEASDLRARASTLHSGIEGLFSAISAWRGIASRVATSGRTVLGPHLTTVVAAMHNIASSDWRRDPVAVRLRCAEHARQMMAIPADDPASRFIIDQIFHGLSGLEQAVNAICLATAAGTERRPQHRAAMMLPDMLPATVNGLRGVIAVLTAELFWARTAWSGAQTIVTFAAVAVTVFSPHGDGAFRNMVSYSVGTIVAFVLAALFNFAVLPAVSDFAGFSFALACVLVPLGGLSAAPWQKAFCSALVINFLAVLSPPNQPVYDQVSFFNSGVAVIAGTFIGCLCMGLLPPVPAHWRARRLITLTVRDLRRLALRRRWLGRPDWASLISCRLEAMPAVATPEELAQLIAALSIGEAVIQLRDWRQTFAGADRLDRALAALGAGHILGTRYWLAEFVGALSVGEAPVSLAALRGQAAALVITDALSRHPVVFAGTLSRQPPSGFRSRPTS